jgi:hypothetical protein
MRCEAFDPNAWLMSLFTLSSIVARIGSATRSGKERGLSSAKNPCPWVYAGHRVSSSHRESFVGSFSDGVMASSASAILSERRSPNLIWAWMDSVSWFLVYIPVGSAASRGLDVVRFGHVDHTALFPIVKSTQGLIPILYVMIGSWCVLPHPIVRADSLRNQSKTSNSTLAATIYRPFHGRE